MSPNDAWQNCPWPFMITRCRGRVSRGPGSRVQGEGVQRSRVASKGSRGRGPGGGPCLVHPIIARVSPSHLQGWRRTPTSRSLRLSRAPPAPEQRPLSCPSPRRRTSCMPHTIALVAFRSRSVQVQGSPGPGQSRSRAVHRSRAVQVQGSSGPGQSRFRAVQVQGSSGPGQARSRAGQVQGSSGPGQSRSRAGQVQGRPGPGQFRSRAVQVQGRPGPGQARSKAVQVQGRPGPGHSRRPQPHCGRCGC